MCNDGKIRLVRIDKNGTKYYETNVCDKCGGKGYIPYYDYVDGGICYLCNGTGRHHSTWKEYTPEYEKKLTEKRFARTRKKSLENLGLSDDGIAYVVMGNTYERKDELKQAGARFCPSLGWYFTEQTENYDTQCFNSNDFLDFLGIPYSGICSAVEKAQEEYRLGKIHSDFVGKIGDKVSVDVTVERVSGYQTQWGWTNVFTMVDTDGNFFVWKTSSGDMEKGSHIQVSGKIKEHSEYKGVKQTVLTRCKVVQV